MMASGSADCSRLIQATLLKLEVADTAVLADMDGPEDYQRELSRRV